MQSQKLFIFQHAACPREDGLIEVTDVATTFLSPSQVSGGLGIAAGKWRAWPLEKKSRSSVGKRTQGREKEA